MSIMSALKEINTDLDTATKQVNVIDLKCNRSFKKTATVKDGKQLLNDIDKELGNSKGADRAKSPSEAGAGWATGF